MDHWSLVPIAVIGVIVIDQGQGPDLLGIPSEGDLFVCLRLFRKAYFAQVKITWAETSDSVADKTHRSIAQVTEPAFARLLPLFEFMADWAFGLGAGRRPADMAVHILLLFDAADQAD